jgi:6-phosphofructo-2-kinase / fructose-2,6-biphosphatase 4
MSSLLKNLQTLFLESYVDDENILRENARNVKINSPDVRPPRI